LANLEVRHEKEKAELTAVANWKYQELKNLLAIANLNKSITNQNPDNTAILAVTEYLVSLDTQNALKSRPIRLWRAEFGDSRFISMLVQILLYFFRQFTVKENLTEVQLMQLAMQIVAGRPNMRMKELLLMLRRASEGRYGSTYQRIGIDTFNQWCILFEQEITMQIEVDNTAANPSEKRPATAWEEQASKQRAYEVVNRAKKEFWDNKNENQ